MALIDCPDCGSRVSDAAQACPQCGRRMDDLSNVLLPQYDVELSHLDVARVAGLIGSVMLALGVFMPFLHLPLVGPVNLFFNGRGIGVSLLIAAVLGFLALLRRSQVYAGIVGLLSIAALVVHSLLVRSRLEEAANQAKEDLAGNPFGQLAAGSLDAIQVQSGFGFMLVGAGLMVVGGFLSKYRHESSDSVAEVSQAAAKVQTWVTERMPARKPQSHRPLHGSEEHERNTWVREQFELWLAAERSEPPRNASERLSLFAEFRARLERGEIDMVALRKAAAARETAKFSRDYPEDQSDSTPKT